jgi:hypothetical protein
VGLLVALVPDACSACSRLIERCWWSAKTYLRIVGPTYPLFGLERRWRVTWAPTRENADMWPFGRGLPDLPSAQRLVARFAISVRAWETHVRR